MIHASLFSGIGGFDLAARWAGWRNLFNCETDPFCRTVLKYHFPDAQQTLPFGETVSTCSPADSLASRSASPENAKGREMTATSGRRCLELFGRFVPVGSWAKTFSELFIGRTDWYSSRCALTWKMKATMSNRSYFRLVVSTLPIAGTGCGLLPTAQTQGLKICVEGKTVFMPLDLLPTPKAQDCRHAMRDRGKSNLGEEMSELAYRQTGQTSQLNPLFVAEMMGFPVDWSASPFRDGEKNPSRPTETQ